MRPQTGSSWHAGAVLLLGLVALVAPEASAAPRAAAAPPSAAARIDSLLARYQRLGRFNGTALVADDGRVVLEKGYGMASFELGVPNRPDTRIWIGSVSKLFTSTLILRLVDQHRLALDDRVGDLLPWYRQDTGARMTVRHLLTHTSGLPDYLHLPGTGLEGFARAVGDAPVDVKAFARTWCSGDLQWEPGTRWGYSNSGYFLLGAIVEEVTRVPFERALDSLVLAPAGLTATGDLAARPHAVVPGMAQGYEKAGGALQTRRPWNLATAFGAGAMYSTVQDLHRFERALERDDFVSPAARAAMFTPGPGRWGCGWQVDTLPIGPGGAPRVVAGHEGYIFWSLTRFYRIAEDGVNVVLINNTGDAPLPAIFTGIADVLYGREPAWPKPSAAEAVHALAVARGGEAAVARYRELEARERDAWEFGERGLNGLGYGLLREGHAAAAVAVFRLMVERFPGSANAHDSLGEGLAATGAADEAIAEYARSLALDPNNRNAAAQIEKLKTR